jgi:hypothetical protein
MASETNQTEQQQGAGYPSGLLTALAAAAVVGAGVFVWTTLDAPLEAWRIYLVNFLVCAGVASGAVALAAILEVSDAQWPWLVRRAAECFATALPAILVLFLITAFGTSALMPWAAAGSGVHKPWLDVTWIYLRGGVGLLILSAIGWAFARRSRSMPKGSSKSLAIAYLFAFVIVSSILAIDLVMALDPHWASSLFGAYFFTGNIYAGIAGAMIMTAAATRWLGAAKYLTPEFQFRSRSNIGKMLLSFSLIWVYMIWSQRLVIWYGNLPQETGYMQLRLATQPWQTLSYIVLICNFVLPFVLLIPKKAKINQGVLLSVSLLVVLGIWLERFILVVPQLLMSGEGIFSLRALLISAGFGSGLLLIVLTSLRRISILEMRPGSASD